MTTPAGWYADPEQPGQQRYWDGSSWTEHRAPGPGAPPPPAAPGWAPAPGYQTSPGYGQMPMGAKPDPWLWQSIVATLLCCLPFGIVGIVYAAGSNSAASAGNWAEAKAKADKARTWTLVAVACGVVVIVAYVLLIAAAGSSSDF